MPTHTMFGIGQVLIPLFRTDQELEAQITSSGAHHFQRGGVYACLPEENIIPRGIWKKYIHFMFVSETVRHK